MKCNFCGKESDGSSKFCSNCGRPLNAVNSKKKNHGAAIAGIICGLAVIVVAVVTILSLFVFDNNESENYVPANNKFSDEEKEKIRKSQSSKEVSEEEVETDELTEALTEKPTEIATEAPTEKPTEAATEAPTEKPTEVATEAPTEQPTEAPTTASPEFTRAEATSILADIISNGKVYSYYPLYTLDGNSSTCWCEGADGDGLGESITLFTDSKSTISRITIQNGLCADVDTFYKNNRVRECELKFSDGTTYSLELDGDFESQPCVIDLPESVETEYVKITILSVYSGTKYTDTCISEISAE